MPAPSRQRRRRGSISQRPDGRWQVRLTRRDGRRITEYVPADTPDGERRAEEVLARLIHEELDSQTEPSKVKLSAWLTEYLRRANQGKAPATVSDRAHLARGITEHSLGRMRLDQITPRDVQRWLDSLDGAHRTRSKRLQLLKAALNEAVALGYLRANPAAPVKIPRQVQQRRVRKAWTADQSAAFLAANEGHRRVELWRLALLTGARIGELLALQVSDYDPNRKTLNIERTVKKGEGRTVRDTVGRPKTPAAVRTVPLSAQAVQCVEVQLRLREAERQAAGTAWSEEGWLFPSSVGTISSYDNARRDWRAALARATVPQIRTHDLRVTFIIDSGLGWRRTVAVSKVLGKPNVTNTLPRGV